MTYCSCSLALLQYASCRSCTSLPFLHSLVCAGSPNAHSAAYDHATRYRIVCKTRGRQATFARAPNMSVAWSASAPNADGLTTLRSNIAAAGGSTVLARVPHTCTWLPREASWLQAWLQAHVAVSHASHNRLVRCISCRPARRAQDATASHCGLNSTAPEGSFWRAH